MKDSGLLLSQLYNADETGLFWKAMPHNTQATRHDIYVQGRKSAKEQVSALLCKW